MQAQALLIKAHYKARAALRARQQRRQAQWQTMRLAAFTLAAQDIGVHPDEGPDDWPSFGMCPSEGREAMAWLRLRHRLADEISGFDDAVLFNIHTLALRPGAADLCLALALLRAGAAWAPLRQHGIGGQPAQRAGNAG